MHTNIRTGAIRKKQTAEVNSKKSTTNQLVSCFLSYELFYLVNFFHRQTESDTYELTMLIACVSLITFKRPNI